jgi:NTP pyrophosphatase (non-canonical NTP hydrolase)
MSSQQRVAKFIQQHHLACPLQARALDLVSEVGEVAKEILKMTDYGAKKPSYREEIKSELGDVYFSLLALSDSAGVHLEEALELVLEKYKHRLKKGSAGSEVEL